MPRKPIRLPKPVTPPAYVPPKAVPPIEPNEHLIQKDKMDKPIRDKWTELGGNNSFLGWEAIYTKDTKDGVGRYHEFEHGYIYWSPNTGAHEIHGEIFAKWAVTGAYQGKMFGYPTSDTISAPDGEGHWQCFEHGLIVCREAKIYLVRGAIGDTWYHEHGGITGALGYPLGDELSLPDCVGHSQKFEHGSVYYWRDDLGALAVYGVINDKWESLGHKQSLLGYPTTRQLNLADKVGKSQEFAHGAIEWRPNLGAHAVYGAIYSKWKSLGWQKGILGYPISEQALLRDGVGYYQMFEHGSIYWIDNRGAAVIPGAIRDKWESLDCERGILGYPITEELILTDKVGRSQQFEHGAIYWRPDLGAYAVYLSIAGKWNSLGNERGRLGYPISDRQTTNSDYPAIQGQRFENGSIFDLGIGSLSAALPDGTSLPETQYELILEKIRCEKQTTDELGSEDELWTRFVISDKASTAHRIIDYHNEHVKSGHEYPVNLSLYQGFLLEAMHLSFMALEVDLDDAAKNSLDTFTNHIKAESLIFFSPTYSYFEYVQGASITANSIGIGLCVQFGGFWTGLIGAIAGGVLDIILGLTMAGYHPELIGTDIVPLYGAALQEYSLGKLPQEGQARVTFYGSSASEEKGEIVSVSYTRINDRYFYEHRRYTGTGSEANYTFTFLHHIGTDPVPDPPCKLSADCHSHHDSYTNDRVVNPGIYRITHCIVYWTASSMGDKGYEVERSYHGSGFVKIVSISAHIPSIDATSSYEDEIGVEPGDEVLYRVRAYNQAGYGPYSEAISVVPRSS